MELAMGTPARAGTPRRRGVSGETILGSRNESSMRPALVSITGPNKLPCYFMFYQPMHFIISRSDKRTLPGGAARQAQGEGREGASHRDHVPDEDRPPPDQGAANDPERQGRKAR